MLHVVYSSFLFICSLCRPDIVTMHVLLSARIYDNMCERAHLFCVNVLIVFYSRLMVTFYIVMPIYSAQIHWFCTIHIFFFTYFVLGLSGVYVCAHNLLRRSIHFIENKKNKPKPIPVTYASFVWACDSNKKCENHTTRLTTISRKGKRRKKTLIHLVPHTLYILVVYIFIHLFFFFTSFICHLLLLFCSVLPFTSSIHTTNIRVSAPGPEEHICRAREEEMIKKNKKKKKRTHARVKYNK